MLDFRRFNQLPYIDIEDIGNFIEGFEAGLGVVVAIVGHDDIAFVDLLSQPGLGSPLLF